MVVGLNGLAHVTRSTGGLDVRDNINHPASYIGLWTLYENCTDADIHIINASQSYAVDMDGPVALIKDLYPVKICIC